MALKVPQSKERLEEILQHTWESLQDYCRKYDEGKHEYALEMAAALRKLFRDTSMSTSLLGQLGLKETSFIDSTAKSFGKAIGPYSGLFCIPVGGTEPKYIPYLDGSPPGSVKMVSFDEWFGQPVLKGLGGLVFNRKDLIGFVADQGGGAHADPKIDVEYAQLASKNSLGQTTRENDGPDYPINEADKAAIRQITHEVLRTFLPAYPFQKMKMPSGTMAALGPMSLASRSEIPPDIAGKMFKVGRNEACPCGALREDGQPKKYKKCHGAPA